MVVEACFDDQQLHVACVGHVCLRESAKEWEGKQEYARTHPPISDEEFLKLCSSDVRPEMALKVREIIADAYGVDREEIYPDTRLIDLE